MDGSVLANGALGPLQILLAQLRVAPASRSRKSSASHLSSGVLLHGPLVNRTGKSPWCVCVSERESVCMCESVQVSVCERVCECVSVCV